MDKSQNIVLIGLGSIGTRHLRNLISLGYTNITVISRSGTLPNEFAQLQVFSTLDVALNNNIFEAAIICTPTAKHVDDLKQLLQHNIQNIYLEKPAGHNKEALQYLQSLINKAESSIIVGYDLHFDLGLLKVRQLINDETIGKPVSINAMVGQYLPDWRPHEDYTKGMSASVEKGGGVMLDLIHEFDYLCWLMGTANSIAAHYIRSGSLNIQTEDAADILLKFENGATGTIHLDYLQPKLVRNCTITCTAGTIFWDMVLSEVKWINTKKETDQFSYAGFERNERFKQIMQSFLEDENDSRLTTLEQGLESLKMVLAAKYSSENNLFVNLETFYN